MVDIDRMQRQDRTCKNPRQARLTQFQKFLPTRLSLHTHFSCLESLKILHIPSDPFPFLVGAPRLSLNGVPILSSPLQQEALNLNCTFHSLRLPELTETEKLLIKGTADFLALNMYSAFLVEHQEHPPDVDWNYMTDQRMKTSAHPSWKRGNSSVPLPRSVQTGM